MKELGCKTCSHGPTPCCLSCSLHNDCEFEDDKTMEEAKYYPPVGSCEYDEHEGDMYYIGDNEGKNNGGVKYV